MWLKVNEKLRNENVITTVKYGGGGVMIWGLMAAAGVRNLVFIEGIMNSSNVS